MIGGVDATLYGCEDCVGSAGGAGFILDVPELIVGVMLGGDEGEPVAGRLRDGWSGKVGIDESRGQVPLAGEAIVEFDDLGRGKNDGLDLFGIAGIHGAVARGIAVAACSYYGRTITSPLHLNEADERA